MQPQSVPWTAAVLPPRARKPEELVALLDSPAIGLPERTAFKTTDYHPHLTLDYVAQPYLVAGADPLGTYVGGGTSLFWSDMLGDHNLVTMFQVSGQVRDIGGLVGYQNLAHRWNWGGVVEHIPYRTGFYSLGVADVQGQPAEVQQTRIIRQTVDSVSGVVAYPFNEARRVEFSTGLLRIGFRDEIRTDSFSLTTGARIAHDTQVLPSPSALNLSQSSAALVYDTSLFGATSPILGQRYRLEATPTVGSINFTNLLGDYRHYFMPVRPYTIAGRILHYGRYGSGAEDNRLVPLYLGYPNLVRGYDFNSFSASECVPDAQSPCPVFDRLLGSRMLVGNAELRFPIYGIFHPDRFYGPLPIEGALFADAGVAWNSGQKPSLFGGDRKAVSSAGAALRINAFGYAVFEIDFVHPFDRPQKNWVWQFNLLSGF